jgi:hypothetical protein
MSPGAIVFDYDGRKVSGAGGVEQARGLRTIDAVEKAAEEVLNLPSGTFDLFDAYGQIKVPEDLQRAIRMAHAGSTDCHLEVKEHFVFQRIKSLEEQLNLQAAKQIKLEALLASNDERTDEKIEAAKKELSGFARGLENKLKNEVMPTVEDLCRDRTQTQKELRAVQEKMASINVQELKEMSESCAILREEVKGALKRVEIIETNFTRDKKRMEDDIKRNREDVSDLSKYISGKIDVCIEADGDLKREVQLTSERMQLLADDLRLNQDALRELTHRTTGALEESEELRTLLGTVREDNEHLRNECGQVRTRVHCIEGTAAEQWEGFAPGILYFRRWHLDAKGIDVQMSRDLSIATGRGFLAATGVVIGSDEGLSVGDGPCRRFGTPGSWSSYFEIEVDEICAAPAGAGGLYVGVSLQNAPEIANHPRKEFDGWLVGGHKKALVCRAAAPEAFENGYAALPPPSALQPAAFGSDVSSSAAKKAANAVEMLRAAMPPKPKGEVRELDCTWNSDSLRPPDKIGCLFKCHRDGGARMRVLLNGQVVCSHEFIEAPPAEAMGFLTPIVRLAGTGKSVKLLPGLSPPASALAD